MSRFFHDHAAGGFRLDSPVKLPVASETPRCAPPHTVILRSTSPVRFARIGVPATSCGPNSGWFNTARTFRFLVAVKCPPLITLKPNAAIRSWYHHARVGVNARVVVVPSAVTTLNGEGPNEQ